MARFGYNFIYYIICVFLLVSTDQAAGQIGKYPIQNFTPTDYQAGIQNIDFAQNRDMNLFVANNLGVLSFDGNRWKVYARNTGKKQRSLAFDEDQNRLYIGSQGEFGFFDEDWEYISLIDLIPESERNFDEVWSVYILDSQVYFCTFQAIYVYNGEAVNVIDHEEGLNRSFMVGKRLFTQSSKGRLYEVEREGLKESIQQNRTNDIVAGLLNHEEGYVIFYNSGAVEFSTLVTAEPAYAELASALGCDFAAPEAAPGQRDVVIHASANAAGLETAIGLAGLEATLVEASWYGARRTTVALGGAFHQRRLRLVSSQVGRIPADHAARWTHRRRLETALRLLSDPALDHLISGESRFDDLAQDYGTILASPDTLCHRVRYDR